MRFYALSPTFFSFLAGTFISAATTMWVGVLLTPPGRPWLLHLAGLAFALAALGFLLVATILEGARASARDDDLLPHLHDRRPALLSATALAVLAAAGALALIAVGA